MIEDEDEVGEGYIDTPMDHLRAFEDQILDGQARGRVSEAVDGIVQKVMLRGRDQGDLQDVVRWRAERSKAKGVEIESRYSRMLSLEGGIGGVKCSVLELFCACKDKGRDSASFFNERRSLLGCRVYREGGQGRGRPEGRGGPAVFVLSGFVSEGGIGACAAAPVCKNTTLYFYMFCCCGLLVYF